ncbi:hypothetical protein EMIT0210MI2_250069 [Priestia megaterium]|nr:hypothetical protein BMG_5734 [Priestia megaterium]
MKNCLVKKSILPENPCRGEQGFFFVENYKKAEIKNYIGMSK